MSVLIFKIGIDVNVYANVYRAPYVTKNEHLRDNPRFLENRLLPVALVAGCLVYATIAFLFFMELV